MTEHLSRAELQADLPRILDSPQHDGTLEAIVIRPEPGEREELESCDINAAGGALRLRGVYARVVEDGRIAAGDRVVKLG